MWFWCDILLSVSKPICICHILLQLDMEQVLGTRQSHPIQPFSARDVGKKLEKRWYLPQPLPFSELQQGSSPGSRSSRGLQPMLQSWFCFSLWLFSTHFHCFCWIWCKVSCGAYAVTCSSFPFFCNKTSLAVYDPSLEVCICSAEANRHFGGGIGISGYEP